MMTLDKILYTIGLVLAVLYLTMGFDDLVWDIYSLIKRKKYKKARLDFKTLRTAPPKLLAITIGAWNESAVIGEVIENLLLSIQYPKSMYHLFVGVYPNDQATIDIVSEIEKRIPNVHMVVNDTDGPTTKAQNINYVISKVKEYESQFDWKFAAVTVHDAEDVVHPYELLVTNYMIDKHDGLQFPVFPLMEMPRFKNFFKNLTVGTYADEFAENHYSIMVGRSSTGAFVPSAGTGFALSRKTIDSFPTDEILPNDSLTEDYRLSLTLFEKGLKIRYVLDKIPRVARNNKVVYDYVATRSMFPAKFKAAVKQKTRWILGITMQSVRFKDVFAKSKLSFLGRYSIYRDLKAKVGNMLVFVGYPVFIYFIVSLFIPLTPIYPYFTPSWYLSLVITVMMLERQISRGIAIYHVYGARSVFFACLFPPIIPIRIVWGNLINMTATFKAYRQSMSGKKRKAESGQKMKSIAWSKTDHTFLPQEVLNRYHRTFGDLLIEKGIIAPEKLKEVLNKKTGGMQIGKYLLQEKIINEEQHLEVLSNIKGIQYINMGDFSNYDLKAAVATFDQKLLSELMVLPVLKAADVYVMAYCEQSPDNAQTILREKYGIRILSAFTSDETVERGLRIISGEVLSSYKENRAGVLLAAGKISAEQYILVSNYALNSGRAIEDILVEMGLDKVVGKVE